MTDYPLYVESGPQHRKTLAHVLDPLGCVVSGPTTEDAVAAAPDAIRAYRHLLKRVGEQVNLREKVEVHVEQHVTEGYGWLGNGDPHIAWEGELEPTSDEELETWVRRFLGMRTVLGNWAATLEDERLDAASGDPRSTRSARKILLHVLHPTAQYVSAILGPTPGYAAYHRHAERGEMSLQEAFIESAEVLAAHIRAATPEQRRAVIHREQDDRTLRKQMRHVLEHEWEHLAELARRPGGPSVQS
jgi:uncharacterized damage-inducible protein DinB